MRAGGPPGPVPIPRPTRKIVAPVTSQSLLFLPLLVGFAALMFFSARKQKRAMQATIDLHESLRIGDRVHTTSGLEGTITNITDDNVNLEIAPGVVTTWMKLAIRDRIETTDLQPEVMEVADEVDGEDVGLVADPDRLTAGGPERLPKD